MRALNTFASCGLLSFIFLLHSCSKPVDSLPTLMFVFKFDSTQARLNDVGQPAVIPANHAAQSPRFNYMSAHYVELSPAASTPLGQGKVLYRAPEVNTGGLSAIDFSKSVFAKENEVWLSLPFKSITPGTYPWLRVSLDYQNYDISGVLGGFPATATVASFIGFRTYVGSYRIKDSLMNVYANKEQGYWGVEARIPGAGGFTQTGQAPAGATTVPNPLFATSPIPAGSCVVTGAFATPLVITGNETQSKTIVVSLSTNKSFEWIDVNNNGIFEPLLGDQVIDMGVRGMIPLIQ